jgi:SAM-dependent methyltransferase
VNGFPGRELSLDPGRGRFERLYTWLFGAPANGLRIRLRRVLPATQGRFAEVLDAGCGSGVFSFELAKRHPEARVLGIELDPDLVDRANAVARRAGLANCRFEQGDVTKLNLDGTFDLVLSVDNLEHVEDDFGAMGSLLRAMRPGGKLVAHVPGYERRWLLLGRRVNFDVPGHVRPGYQAEELAGKLQAVGFEQVRYRYTFGPLETFTNNLSYLISGADQRKKVVYAAAFPVLLGLSWFGQFSHPRWGAGILATARRPVEGA